MAAKYIAIFVTKIKNLLAYRTNIALKLFRPILMTVAIGSLWWVLFQLNDGQDIGGFNKQSFVIYLLVIRFIAVFSPGGASIAEMNEEICTGNITMRLVRPMHYLVWLFFRNLPIPLISGVIGLLLVSVFAVWFDAIVPTGWQAVLFIFSVMATIIIQYAFYQGIGILSFWIYQINSVERFYKMTSTLFSGEMVPLTLFPPIMYQTLLYSPFASLAFVPGGIYIGLFETKQALILVLNQFAWGAVLWTLVIWVYSKGLRKFEAQGG